jgi:hypothetical protein
MEDAMQVDRRQFIVAAGAGGIGASCSKASQQTQNPVAPAVQPDKAGGVHVLTRPGAWSGSVVPPTFTVSLTGLIALVWSGYPDPLDVLLVDGAKTSLHAVHTPTLTIPQRFIAQGASLAKATRTRVDSGHPELYSTFDLTGYQVSVTSESDDPDVKGNTPTGLNAFTGLRPPSSDEPSQADSNDISWVAEVAKIPGLSAGRIDPRCLSADPRDAKIAARLRITQGLLAPRFDPFFGRDVFQFKSGDRTYQQALALAEVRVSVKAPAQMTFRLIPFGAPPKGGTAPFQPKQIVVWTEAPVAIEVANEPTMPAQPCANGDDRSRLPHFRAFYELIDPASPPTDQPIPTCVRNCQTCGAPAPGGGGPGSIVGVPDQTRLIYCPGAMFPSPNFGA